MCLLTYEYEMSTISQTPFLEATKAQLILMRFLHGNQTSKTSSLISADK